MNKANNLLKIFEDQYNPNFPLDFSHEMKPGYGISFKRIGEMEIRSAYSPESFFLGKSKKNINTYYEYVDEPIQRTILADRKVLFKRGNLKVPTLINKPRNYILYQSSLTQTTSDLTRHFYDLVRVSDFKDILAIADDFTEYNPLYYKTFNELKRKSRNIDLGYCYLLDENNERSLYVIFVECYPKGKDHLHCTKVPRVYKPGRYFLVPKSMG